MTTQGQHSWKAWAVSWRPAAPGDQNPKAPFTWAGAGAPEPRRHLLPGTRWGASSPSVALPRMTRKTSGPVPRPSRVTSADDCPPKPTPLEGLVGVQALTVPVTRTRRHLLPGLGRAAPEPEGTFYPERTDGACWPRLPDGCASNPPDLTPQSRNPLGTFYPGRGGPAVGTRGHLLPDRFGVSSLLSLTLM